jgi:hydrogenase nickel incorporation protein HypA/HybF
MHELAIANSVLDAVRAEAAQHAGSRVCRVGLRIGELSGVDPEALRFCFESLVKDSPLDPLPLEIEFCLRRHECEACLRAFTVVDYDTHCPACGSGRTRCVSGTELNLSYLELEEP